MKVSATPALAITMVLTAGIAVSAQTQPAPAAASDVYHVHFTKAAPGQAAALGKALMQPDSTAPMPDHFIVLRHQEGDDWDYAVIQHLGQKTTITGGPAAPNPSRDLRAWHADTLVSGPSWSEFTRQMGIGGSGSTSAVYTVGVHRALPGHREQLEKALNQPASAELEDPDRQRVPAAHRGQRVDVHDHHPSQLLAGLRCRSRGSRGGRGVDAGWMGRYPSALRIPSRYDR